MMWAMAIGCVLVGLSLSAFFSGAETGLYCINRTRLHLGAKSGNAKAIRLETMLQDEPGTLTITLVGTNLMNYLTTMAVAFVLAELVGMSGAQTEVYTVLALTPIVFVFGEVVPKNLFQQHADLFMMRGGNLLWWTGRILRLTGIVWLLTRLAAVTARIVAGSDLRPGSELAPRRRMTTLLQEAVADRQLGADQSALIERVLQLSEIPILSAMSPRNRVQSVSVATDARAFNRMARRTQHTKIPVFDNHPLHITGIIDIDTALREAKFDNLTDLVETVMTISPHETVASAITKMRQAGQSMAVVTDRSGRMLGLVTANGLLEEVVAEMD